MPARKLSSPRSAILQARAKSMRLHPTPSEAALWQLLKARQLGVVFRRQVVIDDLIVDFLAPQARLVVEVDGAYHERRLSADSRRDRRLRKLGFRVVRLEGELVVAQPVVAVAVVREALFHSR